MTLPDLLRALLTTPGPSGHEARAAAVWRDAASGFAEVTTDALGSVVARVPGRGEGPSLVLLAHVDEIGIAVTHVDERGMLSFSVVGAYNPEVLVAQRVAIAGRGGEVRGVIARSYLTAAQRRDRDPVRLPDLHVDVGARDGDEARALVRVGDVGVVLGEPVELLGGRVASRALDNRVGAYVALEAARRVAEAGGAPGDLYAVATVQEEIGHHGATVAAFGLEPGAAIAIDVTPASDAPGADPAESGETRLGSGAAIDRAPILHPRLTDLLIETAEAEGIPYCLEVSVDGTHTDADAVHLSRRGVPSALVSIPTRYLHTPVETADLADVEAAVRLVAAAALRLDASLELTR